MGELQNHNSDGSFLKAKVDKILSLFSLNMNWVTVLIFLSEHLS